MHQITTLDNGLKIITYKQPGVSSVYVGIKVSAGFKYFPKGKEGLPHFVEHMVMNGTKEYPSGLDVSRAIENLGGRINGSTRRDTTNYWIKVVSEDLNKALDVLFPLVNSPLLSEEELPGERKIILEEIARAQDLLGRKVSNALFELVFNDHPLAPPGLGYPETIAKIKYPDITSFVKDFYIPNNIVIVAAGGGVSHERFVRVVKNYFPTTKRRPVPKYVGFKYQPFGPKSVVLPEESKQARLSLAFPYSPQTFHDHMVGIVLAYLLSSRDRLRARLREKEHLAYDVGVQHFGFTDLSLLSVYGGFSYSEVDRAVAIICEELKRIKEGEITAEELRKVKKTGEVRLLFSLESPKGWANFLLRWNHFLGKPVELKRFLGELGEVSISDIQKLGRKIFVPENSYLSVSHRSITSKELEDLLAKGLS